MEARFWSVITPEVRAVYDCDWDRVWRVMRIVMAHQVAASLYARMERSKWIVLRPPSDINLVTADQPLFNTLENEVGEDGYAQRFAIYFPLSPRLAVLVNFNSTTPGVVTEYMPEGNARHFNRTIAGLAHRQVFATFRRDLQQLGV